MLPCSGLGDRFLELVQEAIPRLVKVLVRSRAEPKRVVTSRVPSVRDTT
jgi:hypothetical protein